MRRVLAGALSAAGFDVVGNARDGDEALAQCRATRPDAMTLDLAMPGLDGLGVLRALKESGAPAVPVVVVSAFSPAHGARAVDALAEGAFDLVPKPAVGEPLPHLHREPRRSACAQAVAAGAAAPRDGHAANGHAAPAPPRRRARRRRAPRRSSSPPPPAARARSAELLPAPPAPLGEGTLIVQHMPRRLHRLAGRAPGPHVARCTSARPRGGEPARARHRARSPPAAATCASTARAARG